MLTGYGICIIKIDNEMEKIIGIYSITNPKGRIYIGRSVNIHSREMDYKRLDCKKQPLIYNSLKKYGWENHKFEVVEECKIDDLNKREIYWGKFYNTLKGGLNLRLGDGINSYSDKTKIKMSMSALGSKDSAETRKNKSEAAKGKIKTEKHRQNLSKSATKSFGRKVIQMDLEGNFIKEWDTGKQASIDLKLDYIAINNCCRFNETKLPRKRDKDKIGKYTSFSYIWEYKELIELKINK
tara:strand:- start:19 stop:735 length:717 start_codon:yes stop_codon:yes gene_type:complete